MNQNLVEKLGAGEINLDLFWHVAHICPGWRVHRPGHILELRYNRDGSVRMTFQQMADELGLSRGRAAQLVEKSLRSMRYPLRFRQYRAVLTTGSTVTAAPVDLAARTLMTAQPQVNPDR